MGEGGKGLAHKLLRTVAQAVAQLAVDHEECPFGGDEANSLVGVFEGVLEERCDFFHALSVPFWLKYRILIYYT
jgi:hypothetical protein